MIDPHDRFRRIQTGATSFRQWFDSRTGQVIVLAVLVAMFFAVQHFIG